MLWGELVPVPDPDLAALWYRRAIAYLPGYVKARVHLAEIYASQDQPGDAETLLRPVLSSGDPEVRWRLADVLIAQQGSKRPRHSSTPRALASIELLGRHRLAFADHAAEFYAGSGDDCRRALELARANVANRPTRRAIEQADAIAVRWTAGMTAVSVDSLVALGFLLGLRHAIEADHLAAISTIVTERRSLLSSLLVGASWGFGHTLALLLAGVGVLLLRYQMTDRMAHVLELCVGMMLVAPRRQRAAQPGAPSGEPESRSRDRRPAFSP